MRNLKSVISMVMFAMIISFSGLAFAEMGYGMQKGKMDKETCTAQIKTLRDSATALQVANPVLAKGLSDLADKKAEKLQKFQDWQAKHDAKIKLLQDSAATLKATNPALAQELQNMSEKKDMGKEAVEEKTETVEGQGD